MQSCGCSLDCSKSPISCHKSGLPVSSSELSSARQTCKEVLFSLVIPIRLSSAYTKLNMRAQFPLTLGVIPTRTLFTGAPLCIKTWRSLGPGAGASRLWMRELCRKVVNPSLNCFRQEEGSTFISYTLHRGYMLPCKSSTAVLWSLYILTTSDKLFDSSFKDRQTDFNLAKLLPSD